MLRGFYPKDRKDPSEILYDTLEQETDMWTHLANAIRRPQDTCTVLYGGKNRYRRYSDALDVVFRKNLTDYDGPKPDFIFARGGFEEYTQFLNKFPRSIRVYYGAGKRYMPQHGKWNMVFVDSPQQREKIARKTPHQNVQLLWKPAAPHYRIITNTKQEYDVCFVAVHPKDKRKRVQWVYDTCPRDISILQLGESPGKHPPNVTRKSHPREAVPLAMNSCRVGIAPYTSEDSGPRVIPEMNACGLRVIISEELPIWDIMYNTTRCSDDEFWDTVKYSIAYGSHITWTGNAELAGEHIRNTIWSLWEE